jgi:hypothetical protein
MFILLGRKKMGMERNPNERRANRPDHSDESRSAGRSGGAEVAASAGEWKGE